MPAVPVEGDVEGFQRRQAGVNRFEARVKRIRACLGQRCLPEGIKVRRLIARRQVGL